MIDNIINDIIGIIIGFLIMFIVYQYINNSSNTIDVPDGATNIEKVGDEWYTYTYKNNKFLYKKGEYLTLIKD